MPNAPADLASLDATAQAELVAGGALTPLELVEAAIARIERVNPRLNAVIHPLYEKAREAARSPALARGPFRGVPFLVKDAVCTTAGDPYHAGMRFLKRHAYRAPRDTELARRFRAAGFVFVCKTNTPELALSATTEPLAYGPTRNPWSLEHSTGGSSGGSAAAVAAGLAPAGHANDMGGSIRIPASHCGLVGLKPSRARGTLAPAFGEYWGPLTHEHVVTRSVRDSAAILDCIAGPAAGDPYTAPPFTRPLRDEVGTPPGRLRIGLVTQAGSRATHPDCVAAAESTAALLASLGHTIEPVRIPELDAPQMGPWIAPAVARDLDRYAALVGQPIGPDDVEPMNWMMAEQGRAMSAVEYVKQSEAAFAWARALSAYWGRDFDVLLTPTAGAPPPRIGELGPLVPIPELLAGLGAYTIFTMPFDVTGQPAISLPLAWNGAGLPIGSQLVAEYGREDVLIRLAAQLEEARPWRERRAGAHA
ncbi:MAG: amidase [Deltaproteobacteria bacterium]|nr:amidase [Deltaproteobacteria bacterium]